MILADTSVWVDHLRAGDAELATRLERAEIAGHPLVTAEIALGSLMDRARILGLMDGLPGLPVATVAEVRTLIEARGLFSHGIGYVDAALLAACLLAPGTRLWSRDRRLAMVAAELGCGVGIDTGRI